MKKRPTSTNGKPSALDSADSSAKKRFTARELRVLSALCEATGWLWREDIDRIAGASNGPHVILKLRRKVAGDDGVEMEQVDVIDRDGKHCKPGRYRLTQMGRQRVLQAGFQRGAA